MLIRRILKLLRVKDLNSTIYNIDQYIVISIFISKVKKNNIRVLYRIIREIHLINNLKTYILIENNIIELKEIMLNISKSKTFISSCDIIADISYRQRDKQFIRRIIHAREILSISSKSKYLISVIKL